MLASEIPQGKAISLNEHQVLATHLQTVRVYDQFSTKAFFDALFLGEALRRLQCESVCKRMGLNRDDLWKDHVAQMEEHITFFVLSDIRVPDHASLSDSLCPWSLQLTNERKEACGPSEIREIELTPEFISFFGARLTPHKTAYSVKFPAKDKDGKPFIVDGEGFTLRFCSVKTVAKIYWPHMGSVSKYDRPLVKTQANKARRYDAENRYWL